MKSVFYYDTPIGRLGLAENGRAVTDVLLHGEHPADAEIRETPLLQKAAEQLAEYFGGLRTEFELPLEFEIGTPFERTVWQALSTIPYGETRSYADIARQIGRPAACGRWAAPTGAIRFPSSCPATALSAHPDS